MKRIRFGSASLLLVLALGFGLAPAHDSSAAEEARRCSCMINDEEGRILGVFYREEEICVVEDCWVDVE